MVTSEELEALAKYIFKDLKMDFEKEMATDSSDFVLLSDYVPGIIQEIRYFSTYNFVGERVDGYEEPIALLTKEAARALKDVANIANVQGYRLKIFDAYRPAKAVKHFVLWEIEDLDQKMKTFFYPDIDKHDLFKLGYISSKSTHSRGSTVDLTLVDMDTGKELDMGSPFDYFDNISHPDYQDITKEQYDNRMILQKLMVDGGFEPIDTEWWHFTLKNEPYPETYFEFPVAKDSIRK